MSKLMDQVLEAILQREGGYVNDPEDSGGETNWGITERVARRSGYEGPMASMPREVAAAIYAERYWHALELDEVERLSPAVAAELADTGVNQGVARAGEFLQRCLNVLNASEAFYPDLRVDGDVGPRTLDALRAFFRARRQQGGEFVLLKMLNALQGAFYIDLAERRPKDEKFIFGWFSARIS